MTNRVALDNVAHHDLKVALRHGAAYGDGVNQVLIFPTEFEEAQREFPILFRRDPAEGLQAVALLGLDRDENLFLEGDRWTGRHIPVLQQRGPFLIGLAATATAPGGPEPTIHVDLDDPRVGAADGEPLFLPHGGNARYLDHVTQILALIYAGMEAAPPMYAAFDALELLQPVALEVMLNDEERYTIDGFEMVARERLAALSSGGLEQLHRAGYLSAAFLLAASLGNISRLIDRKNARRASA
ncbi:SapC family protein [Sphingomonas sp. JC676]|uniref:SapC family protein n=1 Tax=Sphingomonas sp. JC676 TaxID=2768065 RepID=UPI00165833F8|nr:SapC family protein [Sphingomonas sp. JC676]MBC9033417.1 SapC family protein [Sphingomonas sp. JC676]